MARSINEPVDHRQRDIWNKQRKRKLARRVGKKDFSHLSAEDIRALRNLQVHSVALNIAAPNASILAVAILEQPIGKLLDHRRRFHPSYAGFTFRIPPAAEMTSTLCSSIGAEPSSVTAAHSLPSMNTRP